MMSVRRLTRFFFLVLAAAVAAGSAGAAELKVLAVDAMKPALQQLKPAMEKAGEEKVAIEYATSAAIEKKIDAEDEYDIVIVDKAILTKLAKAAKVAGGLLVPLAKDYEASETNWTMHALDAQAVIEFLAGPQAKEVYKSKGLTG